MHRQHPVLAHPVLDADPVIRMSINIPIAALAFDVLEQQLFDESIYASLYMWDAVWAVGPRIDEKSWSENLFYGDIRNINGYEWIEPRQ